MDDEMIDRMASAILVEAYSIDGMVIKLSIAKAIVKSIVKAMHEPTEKMQRAGLQSLDYLADCNCCQNDCWHAMIDAITND